MELKDRFLHYVSFDTQSDENSTTYPSTEKQLVLLKALKEEMISLGLTEVTMDSFGYVMGTIPATPGMEEKPVIGFIAHVDTSPDMSGANVKPQIIENYDGRDIPLNKDLTMYVKDFPELSFYKGHTLITTDGTTLLGADDKAGVAEIMTMAEYFMNNPQIAHGKIRIGFTPDEEIGRGVDHFDVKAFGAQFAYTMDGGFEGELEYENFNAASAKLSIQGRNIHPGAAKGKMINALQVACDLHEMLPVGMRPELTEHYEGFFHLIHLSGSVEQAEMAYIIRDHDKALFEEKKGIIASAVSYMNKKMGQECITLTLKDQYYNMKEQVIPYPELITRAQEAMKMAGVTPIIKPIRGGTDGSRLSYMGLPCPNLFTGGMNFHGKYEYCSLTTMNKALQTMIHLASLWSN
ncbi:peptidase T [Porphyromonas gingivicanis]|uniref:Peptidase T n=1 Tax=Porphyromonas gingivicanis TaxID=266762 RepID=A0A0A2G6V4_9PORP|nr:peptidase T [Porphyromonas gingivicanis]KGN98172.1 peptidase T [Porphyromonas gingivicanis]